MWSFTTPGLFVLFMVYSVKNLAFIQLKTQTDPIMFEMFRDPVTQALEIALPPS